ncbi:MAG TPA: hypothetical protein EYP46_03910 [Hadesarchaea archaeon]|nr:hypothetical protein [Hadesarchaea archaeon]
MTVGEQTQVLVPKFREDCLVSKGIEVRDLLKVRKETILYVQPCASERGKLMADIELQQAKERFIDPTALCWLLETHRRRFAELKCSPNLGVAKLKWRGREISIFKNGKLKIQRALNREEILRLANSVSRLVWGAALCEVCGQPVLRCASGDCERCASAEKIIMRFGEIPNAELLRKGYLNLEKAQKLSGDEFEKSLRTAEFLALHFTMESPNKEDAVLGLILLGKAKKLGTRKS